MTVPSECNWVNSPSDLAEPSFLHTSLDWTSCCARLVRRGRGHIKSAAAVDRRADGKQLCPGSMTSSVWGLLCFTGILASGTLGTFPPFGTHNRKIHSISPSFSRVSPQAPPRSYQTFQELGGYTARGFQQQQRTNNYLTQERRRADSAGWLVGRDTCVLYVRWQYPSTCNNPLMSLCEIWRKISLSSKNNMTTPVVRVYASRGLLILLSSHRAKHK